MEDPEKKKRLQSEIEELERRLKEEKARLPAHSVSFVMIQRVEELEDELDARRDELRKMQGDN